MKSQFTIIASLIAVIFWFFDSFVHFIVYQEASFEVMPNEFNELWMRIVIVSLIALLGLFADFYSKKLLEKQQKIESTKVYQSMLFASTHIINNLLNQMQLFRIEAERSQDYDPEMLKLYDNVINEAQALLDSLSRVDEVTEENIWASVDPKLSNRA